MKTKRNKMLAELMQSAWFLARQGAKDFGGQSVDYIRISLCHTWHLHKILNTWSKSLGKEFCFQAKHCNALVTKKLSRATKKECRELAKEMIRNKYALYDAIWTDRIRITPSLSEHGQERISKLNKRMPNLFVHQTNLSTIDQIAVDYGFETVSALLEFLEAYEPRKAVLEEYYEFFLKERIQAEILENVMETKMLEECSV